MSSENGIRLGSFFGVLLVMMILEALFPKRPRTQSKSRRWLGNFGLIAVNTVMLKLLLPTGAVGATLFAEAKGWGILHFLQFPYWINVILTIVVLDFIIYGQHVVFHAVPILWRLHMVHHTDLDLDASSGLRFHTIEILLSMLIKMTLILLIGPPVFGVVLFEILLNGTSVFNHSNLRMPNWLDRILRLVVVTPDMHRVHHSAIPTETNSNFGFNLPWWDRLCGTYRSQPSNGHSGMTIGLTQFRDKSVLLLHRMLILPFIGQIGDYPALRRRKK